MIKHITALCLVGLCIFAINVLFYTPSDVKTSYVTSKYEQIVNQFSRIFGKGWRFPKPPTDPKYLFPNENGSDRILDQLMQVPTNVLKKTKKILLFPRTNYREEIEQENFIGCPVSSCQWSFNLKDFYKVDAVLFYLKYQQLDLLIDSAEYKPPRQVWILSMYESPDHTGSFTYFENLINWTMTYRLDSDIANPYGKWVYYNNSVKNFPAPIRNFAENKRRKVVWFVSNCHARNNRLHYARELQKFISVDIVGKCGDLICPHSDKECFVKLQNYKFYLAFENSNCKEYITEKLFLNSLEHDILPIVMGARREDYVRVAPLNSFIHVEEFKSPKALARYLHRLDHDDDLYNSYFKWKGTGEMINSRPYCRLCALLHSDFPAKVYKDVNDWWRSNGTCTPGYWKNLGK